MRARRGQDPWTAGEAYDPYMGRWSRLVARAFLAWLHVPAGGRWLDVGCGTGALTQAVLHTASPREVWGVDPSVGYLAYARRAPGSARARFVCGEAEHLPCRDGAFDCAVSGLVLNFVPRPEVAAGEMTRAVGRGGTVASYVWDYAGDMQIIRYFWDAAAAVDPGARTLDEGARFPLCRPDPLRRLFEAAGLGHVELRAIDVPTRFRDFDDYWTPFLGGQGPAPGYVMSLPEDHRAALRDHLRRALPVRRDGSIPLVARAWAVRGTVPS